MAAKKTSSKKNKKADRDQEKSLFLGSEILIILFFLISLLLFLSNFGLIGKFGEFIRMLQLEGFGIMGYLFPIVLFVSAAFVLSNRGNNMAWFKVLAAILALIALSTIVETLFPHEVTKVGAGYLGGGQIGIGISKLFVNLLGKIGCVLVMVAVFIISLVYITEKSFVNAVKKGTGKAYNKAKEDAGRLHEEHLIRREERMVAAKEARQRRLEAKVEGINFAATDLTTSDAMMDASEKDLAASVAEIQTKSQDTFTTPEDSKYHNNPDVFVGNIAYPKNSADDSVPFDGYEVEDAFNKADEILEKKSYQYSSSSSGQMTFLPEGDVKKNTEIGQIRETVAAKKKSSKPYKIPPMHLLTKGEKHTFSDAEYKETAIKLQQTLRTFGIAVTVTNISCGPAVTRYEMTPEIGVKVSRIMSLQDDLKLALAAPDIRIEAPIPGKAAIGIEVPNSENATVCLRDLLESKNYKESRAKIAFALGKDLTGSAVVTDVSKMPHLLIAGATGSGKSVCINTLILSLLYKYSPEDLKLLMVDPKVVELSVYNGIPHLLVPVVNDPKKAAGALNWAVAEMEDRYRKFEAIGAKDIDSYNARVEAAKASFNDDIEHEEAQEELPEKMPRIVIIIDELADLMMVAKNDVETAIVRLTQLARAAGMHVVIATQRPSVNVITGLIKANIPSRIAFAVSSGVDSRTIIDQIGAERLLGKGDMLFSPQGAPKPMRIQGAFVSEMEIGSIVEYIKNENLGVSYTEDTINKVSAGASETSPENLNLRDDLFVQAGRFIIDKDKASIGNLQRAFRIGFNRAARIMDQLCDAGVVGPEQGTKPREVLMSIEQFEEMCDE